jgi:excinuclease UvrABC ATPase subunit
MKCRSCDGEGYWMAPVYHNERVRERCPSCRGRCIEPEEIPTVLTKGNVINVDFTKKRK